jgi:hypothetical protein
MEDVTTAVAEVQPLPEDFSAFKAARQGATQPATSVVETAAPTPEESKPTEAAPSAGGEKPPETAPGSEPGKETPKVEQELSKGDKAFAQMRRAMRELKRENQELADRVAQATQAPRPEMKAPPEPQAKTPQAGEPVATDFDDYDKYIVARTNWVAEQKVEALLLAREQARAEAETKKSQEVSEARRKKIAEGWTEKMDQAVEAHEDFEEVLRNAKCEMSEDTMQYIVEHDNGAELAYHLATHPEGATYLLDLVPAAQRRELDRLAAYLAAPPAKPMVKETPVSRAPKPPSVVGAGAAPVTASIYDEGTANNFTKWKAARMRTLTNR